MIRRMTMLSGNVVACAAFTRCDWWGSKKVETPPAKKTPWEILKSFDLKDPMNSASKIGIELLATDEVKSTSVDVHGLIKGGVPGEIGYGFMMGYTSGFTVKKVSKLVAFLVGAGFICMQALSYNGYVTINYGKLEKEAGKMLDLNKDGKIDDKDMILAYGQMERVLFQEPPHSRPMSTPSAPTALYLGDSGR